MNCPYKVVLSLSKGVWRLKIVNDEHNHEVSLELIGHSMARRPDEQQKEKIRHLGKHAVPTKRILSILKDENHSTNLSSREVYNELNKSRKELMNGKSSIDVLLEQLIPSEDFVCSQLLDDDRLSCFFLEINKAIESEKLATFHHHNIPLF